MRLSSTYRNTIKSETKKLFGENSEVYLFGSRVDDTKKGGDIDLYIETKDARFTFENKIKLLTELNKKLGEQKIDIIVNDFTKSKDIYIIAKNTGILL